MHLQETNVPKGTVRRMWACMVGQASATIRCPESPDLKGKRVLITGATGGIGAETARGLAQRGADLIVPCRNPAKGEAMRASLLAEPGASGNVEIVAMDLEDLESVERAAGQVIDLLGGRPLDVLIENAGIWPQKYRTTKQGYEIAFGVNVLAHFALRKPLLDAGLLEGARIVMVTGDIYVMQSDCTPDFTWSGLLGGTYAYCRSKLGNVLLAQEMARRFESVEPFAVHPGVCATDLGGSMGSVGDRFRASTFISPELGAQMSLLCATQPGLQRGGYYHNTQGLVRLPAQDPANDPAAGTALWERCEALLDA